ncbi:Uncharacterised protein [uncultured archaeon]|nr:Uncharacterised protein [uncultured archaeon]
MKNKSIWPLLVVAMLALGAFLLLGFSKDETATGSYYAPKYFNQPPVVGPVSYPPEKQSPVYVVPDASSLNPNACILAREIKRVESMHGIPSTYEFDSMIMYCDSKNW